MPFVVEDGAGGQRIRLDRVAGAILASLDHPRESSALRQRVERMVGVPVPPRLLARQVQFLARACLLEGPRSAAFLGLVAGARQPARDRAHAQLAFLDGLQHECQACGGCCMGTDVGPLDEAVVRRIEAHDFGDRVPARAEGIPLFRQVDLDGQPIWLTGSRKDACVFLTEDKLCRVHAELGRDAKPSICKQFPYLFTATPDGRVAVSVQLECRAYLTAKHAASPPSGQQEMLRELLEAGAFVQSVAEPVAIAPGLHASFAEYEALERDMIAAFDGAASGPVSAALAARDVLAGWVSARLAPLAAQEGFLDPASWAAAFPAVFADREDPAAALARRRAAFVNRVATHAREEAQRHGEAGHLLERDRFVTLERAFCGALLEIDPTFFRLSGGLDEVLHDAWRAAVFAKEPIQQGTLADGLGRVHLRMALIRGLACQRAQEAHRMDVFDQDAVDSMVVVHKMGRQRSVARLLRAASEAVTYLYVDNLSALLAGGPPQPASPMTGILPS